MSTHTLRRRILLLLAAAFLFSLWIIKAASQATTPDTPEAHLGKGYDALKQDRYDAAVTEFRAALAADPGVSLRARFPLAVALFELHKSEEARHELELVRREVGDHPNVFYYLGRLDLDDHLYPSAIQNLTKAAAQPPFPDTAYYLGYACFKQGNLAAAEKWLKEASRLTPRDARVPYQLGLVYRKQGREQEATKSLALSEELRQRDSEQSRLRMECRQKLDQGLREEARAVCEQLYDPDDADKLTELGTIYGQYGDPQAALKPLRRAAELAPQSPQMQYNLALTYYRLNQFEQARAALANSVKRWPDLFQLTSLYGAILAKLGQDLRRVSGLAARASTESAGQPKPRTCSMSQPSGWRKRARARGNMPSRCAIWKKLRRCGLRRPNHIAAWLKSTRLTSRPAQAAEEKQKADRLASPGGLP